MNPWIKAFSLKGPQADAVTLRDRDVVVTAGAGSGKTRTLAARYLSLLDDGGLPRKLAAVTFTEKAAREARNRIRQAVHDRLAGNCAAEDRARWEAIEADIDTARIGTIHGLCAALLRAHPAEAGIDPRFGVLDEGLAAALSAQAIADALDWAITEADFEPVFAAFDGANLEALLSFLLKSRLDALPALEAADSTERWNKHLCAALRHFTEVDEVQSAIADLRGLGVGRDLLIDGGDKLAEQVKGLLAQWEELEGHLRRARGLEAALALFRVRREYCLGTTGKKGTAKDAVKALRETFDVEMQPWLGGKNKADPAPDPALEAQLEALLPLIARLFEHTLAEYQAAKDQRQVLDFDDLEGKALALLQNAGVRARWQKQIDALLVDEFQDTNARQRQIVEALSGTNDGLAGRLFVVGDEKQSIYRFRGADVTVFRGLGQAIRDRNGQALALDVTFRAHAGLIAILNEVLGGIMDQQDDPARPYRVPFAPLIAYRAEADARRQPPYLEFLVGSGKTVAESRPAAAALLARRLGELHADEGVPWEDVALLFRASAGFADYEAALEAAGIPFVTVAGRGFYDRPEIRDLLNLLRALADPWDDLAQAGVLRSPAFGLSDAALYHLRRPDSPGTRQSFRAAFTERSDLTVLSAADRQAAQRARETLNRLLNWVDRVPVADLLKAVLDETLYTAILASAPAGPRLQRNVDKLLADAHAGGMTQVTEFLEYIETLNAAGAREGEAPAEAGGAVRLMTVHKAKGLEFPVTVLADAGRARPGFRGAALLSADYGLVPAPSVWDGKPLIFKLAQQLEDEQSDAEDVRLLYVAATRAKEKLIVCGGLSKDSKNAWLGQMAAAAGVDLETLAAQPGERLCVTLPSSGKAVSALADALREIPTAGTETATPAQPDSDEAPLFAPLTAEAAPVAEARPAACRRVTGRLRQPDGTVVGNLVHAALHRWRFPGDPGFESLLLTTARMQGVVAAEQLAAYVERAAELLARLRADPRWAEITAMEHHHEVPYSLVHDGRQSGGFIDLLFRQRDGRWQIVDFKTDAISGEAALDRLVEASYLIQMRRYREAVSNLLQQPAETVLCLLDYSGSVRWKIVI